MAPSHLINISLTWMTLLLLWIPPAQGDSNPGTTEHIKEIFLGRCYDYRQVRFKTVMPQPPCAVDMSNYEPFMEAARQEIPENKAMFWSGVKRLASEYAAEATRYVTLEDTLIGYLVDELVWCGQGSAPGMNYTRCPSWTDCPLESSESFWGAASKTFASSASGQVVVMLDGSRPDRPAYRTDSFFAKYEVPSLNPSAVTKVLVLLTHPLDAPEYETCTNGSLTQLESDVTSRGLQFDCEDDPAAILHLLCADDPSVRECRLAANYVHPDTCGSAPNTDPSGMNSNPGTINTKLDDHFLEMFQHIFGKRQNMKLA